MHISRLIAKIRTRAISTIIVWSIGALGLISVNSASAFTITFDDFSSPVAQTQIRVNEEAEFKNLGSNTVIRLTPNENSKAGSAFYAPGGQGLRILPTSDFETTFEFQITSDPTNPTTNRSDGLAFVVQGTGSDFLRQDGESLGYRGNPLPSLFQYFYAIEFDTYNNSSTNDSGANEIAVTRTRCLNPSDPQVCSDDQTEVIASTALDEGTLDNGEILTANIKYNSTAGPRSLLVQLFDSNDAIITGLFIPTLPDDLFHFGGTSTYLGFTAATGAGFANHDILSWTVTVPSPPTWSLFGIGLLASLIFSPRRRKV